VDEVWKIYALSDSDMEVRYVGMTTRSLVLRTKGHISESKAGKTPKDRWLQDVGERLVVRELERFQWMVGMERPSLKERRWIDRFRQEGCKLFNNERRAKQPPFRVIELQPEGGEA
jgi:hypothetical protein